MRLKNRFVIAIYILFALWCFWALLWGPLSECPFHEKDPNTGDCIGFVIIELEVNDE